jgi:hypothetical protein
MLCMYYVYLIDDTCRACARLPRLYNNATAMFTIHTTRYFTARLVRRHGTNTGRSSARRACADGRSGVGALRSGSVSLRARAGGDARSGNERGRRRSLRARALVCRWDFGNVRARFCTYC